jgi:urea transport system substrate-binding protein
MKKSEIFGRKMLCDAPGTSAQKFSVGLLVPLSGVLGMLGPSAHACARLATEALNKAGGLNGREVHLTVLDAGQPSAKLDRELDDLLCARQLDALVTLSDTPRCQGLSKVVDARVPMIYTTLFEGAGLPDWVHSIGETPDRHLLPAVDWLMERYRVRRWYLLGNDYCWPRFSHASAIPHLRSRGAEVVGERYVPQGERCFEPIIEEIARSRADVVLISLIGSDSVRMCRAFAQAGLSDRILRLSVCIEENGLLGMGHRNTAGLFIASGYFATLESAANETFKEHYLARFGERAPTLNSSAQAVYEGFVHLQHQSRGSRITGSGQALPSVRATQGCVPSSSTDPIFIAEAEGLSMKVIQPLAAGPV